MINLGIIGCGRQVSKLLVAIEELNLFKVKALCDIDSEAIDTILSSLPDKKEIFVTADYKKLVDQNNIQAVLIATPTNVHISSALYALKKGKDIFLEKPLGVRLEEIDSFIIEAAKSDCIVQVGFPFHHAYFFNTAQSLLTKDKLGQCKYIHVIEHRGPFLGDWFFEKSKSGGTINDKLIHFFDISNTTFKSSEAVSVYASGSQHFYHKNMQIDHLTSNAFKVHNPDVVDNASVIVNYDDSSVLSIALNMYQKRPIEGLDIRFTTLQGEHLRAFGEGSEIEIEMKNDKKEMQVFEVADKSDSDVHGLNHPGAKEEFRNFAENITLRKQPEANLWRARRAQVIAFAAENSLVSKKVEYLNSYENPEIERLAKIKGWSSQSRFKYYSLSPKKTHESIHTEKDLIDKLNVYLRKLFPKKNSAMKKINENDIRSLLTKINNDPLASEFIKDINQVVTITLPWNSFTFIFAQGKVELDGSASVNNDMSVNITLTEKGYSSLIANRSLAKAYLLGDIKLTGDLAEFQKNRKGLEYLLRCFRQESTISRN